MFSYKDSDVSYKENSVLRLYKMYLGSNMYVFYQVVEF